MGANESRLQKPLSIDVNDNSSKEKTNENIKNNVNSIDSNTGSLDPRSPTANILRTPLVLGVKSSEAETIENTTSFNVQFTDPRSPTIEFNRTPILIEKTDGSRFPKTLLQVATENCGKLAENSPKITGSTKIIKPRVLSGYLETNIDFIETNLDLVGFEKQQTKKTTIEEESNINKDVDSNDVKISVDDEDEVNKTFIISNTVDNKVDSSNDRTNEVCLIENINNNDINRNDTDDLNDTCDITESNKVNDTNVERFERKLTDLIYCNENEREIEILKEMTRKKLKITMDSEQKRTPLGDRNSISVNNNNRGKLRVSDKPNGGGMRKSDSSKIPVFNGSSSTKTNKNGLSIKRKIKKRENNVKVSNQGGDYKKANKKLSNWDSDKTMII